MSRWCDHKFIDSKHCLKCGWVGWPRTATQHAPAPDYSSELTAENEPVGCVCGEQGCHACDADEFYAEMRVRLADRSPA